MPHAGVGFQFLSSKKNSMCILWEFAQRHSISLPQVQFAEPLVPALPVFRSVISNKSKEKTEQKKSRYALFWNWNGDGRKDHQEPGQ